MYALLENTDFASLMLLIPESVGLLASGVGLIIIAGLLRNRLTTKEKLGE
ncbi:MAG: hypothetical protein WKF34_02170 [Pyrinomonadaceae bacterium]